jgi:hypothetical protein
VIPAVAFCPHPPLLVPAVMGDGAAVRDDLRAACLDVVRAMLGAPAVAEVLMVGAGSGTGCAAGNDLLRHPGPAWGTLGGYGVAVDAPAGHQDEEPTLPLSLTVGRWLLEAAGWSGPARGLEVPPGLAPQRCAELGRRLAAGCTGGDAEAGTRGDAAAGTAVTGLLLLADGSTMRTPKAPGGFDPRAAGVDGAVAAALAAGDPDALARLDDGLAAAVGASGRAAWQVLAAAVAGRDVRPRLVYDDAPYGVGYLVAHWALR